MASFGVIFDADGVLFDSERQSLAALYLAVKEMTSGRVELGPDLLAFVCGRDDNSIVDHLNRQHGLSIDTAVFRSHKIDCYRRVIADDPITVTPGALSLLDQLEAARVPYAISTAAVRAKIDLSLSVLGLAHRFPIITSLDDVSAGKPDPAVFLLSAKRLGLSPDRLIVFEDSINGVVAANRAGMYSVGVTGTFTREQLSEARQVIADLRSISVPLLENWLNDSLYSKGEP
jgi:HAD superfamily hydrolase (TIGR01509 family)